MAITLTYGATTLTLPDDLLWTNEFDWTPVQSKKTYAAAGALVVDRGVRLAGRPITLQGGADYAWLPRSMALTLLEWASIPGAALTLLLRGVSYAVQFDHEGDSPLAVTPVVDYADPAPEDFCYVVLRFIITG